MTSVNLRGDRVPGPPENPDPAWKSTKTRASPRVPPGDPTKLEGSSQHNRRTRKEGAHNPGNPNCSPSPVRTGWYNDHSVPHERTRKNQGRNLAVWLFYTGHCSRKSQARSKTLCASGPRKTAVIIESVLTALQNCAEVKEPQSGPRMMAPRMKHLQVDSSP